MVRIAALFAAALDGDGVKTRTEVGELTTGFPLTGSKQDKQGVQEPGYRPLASSVEVTSQLMCGAEMAGDTSGAARA